MLAEIADGSLIKMSGDCLAYSFAVALANNHRLLFNKSRLPVKTARIGKRLDSIELRRRYGDCLIKRRGIKADDKSNRRIKDNDEVTRGITTETVACGSGRIP